MFCYPINKDVNRLDYFLSILKLIYRQDVGILFRSVKFSVRLT